MKIFSEAFRTKGDISNSNFTHGDSHIVYKSPKNMTRAANLSRPIAEAFIAFFDGTIHAIGVTDDGEIYVEMTSRSGRYDYQILYSFPVIQMYSPNLDLGTDRVGRHHFVPIFIENILNMVDDNIGDNFINLRSEVEVYGLPLDKNRAKTEMSMFQLSDYFYFQNRNNNYEVIVDPISVKISKDLTSDFTGNVGDYKFTKGPGQTKKKQSTKPAVKKTKKITRIDFGEPLPEDMLDKIPVLPDHMQIPDYLEDVREALALGETRSVLLYGSTGTGKTTNAKLICRDIHLPLISVVNCTSGLDETALGKFVPKGSEFVFFQSELSDAIEWGGAVVFEEINFGDPKYMSFLNSLLDDNGFVRLDNGKVIKRHPQFRFFATMNPNYEGTNSLNKALKNRFDDIEEVIQINDDEMLNSILKEIKIDKSIVEGMLVVMNRIQSKIDNEELDTAISIRNIKNWAKRTLLIGSPLEAARKTVINPVSNFDKELKSEILEIVKFKFPK